MLKVKDTFLDRVVLFKSMHDAAHNEQLVSEIRGLSKARSRHVVEIYDVVFDAKGNVTGIIIEFLKGRDFEGFHKEFKSDISAFLRVVFQIAAALSDLHSAGVTHRDLKIENIKATSSGIVKLFDFGISTVGSGYSTKNNRGTLLYAAPELFVRGALITPEMDMYALGMCAWALATDAIPAQFYEIPPQRSGRGPSIDTVSPGHIPPAIVELLDRCTSPDPANRPKASDVRGQLASHLVRGKHKGLFVKDNAEIFELSDAQKNVRIKIGKLGELKVGYDGLRFQITGVSGSVSVNNGNAVVGATLPDACVLAFGPNTLGAGRTWIPFAASHPEVIL